MASTLEIFSSVVTACRNPVSNNSLTISCLLRESPPTLQKFLPEATAPLPSQSPLCVLARSSLIALSMASSMFALHWWLGISRGVFKDLIGRGCCRHGPLLLYPLDNLVALVGMPVGCNHGLAHQSVANGTHEGVVLSQNMPLSFGPQQRVAHTPLPFLQCGAGCRDPPAC